VADLLAGAAPRIIQRVLEVLPYDSTVYHTRWCGREINFPIQSRERIPRENQTATANTGDVVYPKGGLRLLARVGNRRESAPGIGHLLWRRGNPGPPGLLAVNVFARVSQDQWPLCGEIGLRVWQHGIEPIGPLRGKVHVEQR
jgi:hypothetical protein